MDPSQPSIHLQRFKPGTAFAAAVLWAILSGAHPAHAHIDVALESGIIQLDSATVVARGGATTFNWRGANPLSVPDRFGPGAILSAGSLRMKVINDGTLGNPYTTTSSDPAGQWPGTSGIEYLNAITLAVGAKNPFATDLNAVRRVSYFSEWRPPTLDAVDRIYTAYDAIVNGNRYVNDDGDLVPNDPDQLPRIDEDFHDGHDNDGDGLIDEDYDALGQQEFTYVIRDDTPEAVNTLYNEKHVPLGIEVKVRAWAYSITGYQDFNVCEYKVTNVSGHMLDSLTIGWLVDMDAGPAQLGSYWTDDLDFPNYPSGTFTYRLGSQQGDLPDPGRKQGGDRTQSHAPPPYLAAKYFPVDSALCPRFALGVKAFSVGDKDGDQGRTPGIGTFMLIDHTLDITGGSGPSSVGFRSFRSSPSITPFAQGGIPRTDQERFQSMVSRSNVSGGSITARQGSVPADYVQWCSIGPWRNVQPGITVSATVAFGVANGTTAQANEYAVDYQRYQAGALTGADLIARYPSLAMALTAQVAFEGIHEYRQGYLETRPVGRGGRDFHGRETPLRLPKGMEPVLVTKNCGEIKGEREEYVTDAAYTWFDFDCDFCTGVWTYQNNSFPSNTGLFHKYWNAVTPPPSPVTNISPQYNFSDNPDRKVVASGGKSINVAWDNSAEVVADPQSKWLDFRGYNVWKASDWLRPVGSAGPNESDWLLLGEFHEWDYYKGTVLGDPPLEANYTRNPTTGEKTCPLLFVPNYFDPVTKLYGKAIPVCLDRFDLWDREGGQVIKPDWTVGCEIDTVQGIVATEINTGELEWNAPGLVGGSFTHVYANASSYAYMCMRHPTQKGTVVVAEGGADSAIVQILNASAFSPASVTIRPGGSVRWVNQSAANHVLQTDRHCKTVVGVIVHRTNKTSALNFETRIKYPVGRYVYVDHEVNNGFLYFYSVTSFDSVTAGGVTTMLGGRRSAFESEAVVPEARVDQNGKKGAWVVPNPYRGNPSIIQRPSAWDLTPNPSDPTGTHIDFMGLPRGPYTIRIYTVSGDLVQSIQSSDPVNASVRHPVTVRGVELPGYNRQQDSAEDGQARWNLISRNGQDVVSGIYLFTVESGEGTQRGKFVIIR